MPPGPVELLPDRLAAACAAVLGVPGAGLSVFNEHVRVPLGASGDVASFAERLQFTAGQGPCRVAQGREHPVRTSAADMRQRWPRFYGRLTQHTPYRSVVSLPLPHLGGGWRGALDLYLDQPTTAYIMPLAQALVVADAIAAELSVRHAPGVADERRMQVWVAVGTVAREQDTTAEQAVKLLRGYAPDEPLESVAERVLTGSLLCQELQRS